MKYLFLDTNIWLHFKRVEDYSIDDLGLGSDLMVIVPDIILHELDNHKDNGRTSRIKSAALHVTKCIREVSRAPSMQIAGYFRNGIGLGYFMDEPSASDMLSWGLRSEKNDDVFLASVVTFSAIRGIDLADVIVVTNDTKMQIVTEAKMKLKCHELPEAYKLKEDDEATKRVKELERIIAKLQSQAPNLNFCFNGSQPDGIVELMNTDYRGVIDEVDSLDVAKEITPLLPVGGRSGGDSNSNHELGAICSYNQKVEKYYEKYEAYLIEVDKYMAVHACAVKVNFSIKNSANVATNVELEIKLPEGFHFIEELPREPKEPEPPEFRHGFHHAIGAGSMIHHSDLIPRSAPKLYTRISKDGRKAEFGLDSVKSGGMGDCDEVYIMPDSPKVVGHTFEMNYVMTCNELLAERGSMKFKYILDVGVDE